MLASLLKSFIATLLALSVSVCHAQHQEKSESPFKDDGEIQWYSTLDSGLAAAKEMERPILFVSAGPHCGGVSGVW